MLWILKLMCLAFIFEEGTSESVFTEEFKSLKKNLVLAVLLSGEETVIMPVSWLVIFVLQNECVSWATLKCSDHLHLAGETLRKGALMTGVSGVRKNPKMSIWIRRPHPSPLIVFWTMTYLLRLTHSYCCLHVHAQALIIWITSTNSWSVFLPPNFKFLLSLGSQSDLLFSGTSLV